VIVFIDANRQSFNIDLLWLVNKVTTSLHASPRYDLGRLCVDFFYFLCYESLHDHGGGAELRTSRGHGPMERHCYNDGMARSGLFIGSGCARSARAMGRCWCGGVAGHVRGQSITDIACEGPMWVRPGR
jgi:hypothetical protein